MDLNVGDILQIVCPHTPGSQDIPLKAEVRSRAKFSFGEKRQYGIHYIR